ncbi:MAG: AAA family ATPase [Planctomycetes bacterium]|nr:AAA family ATPase [Planctomycetota bacterium]
MIESIDFRNFRVLRNTTLPLGRCTVLVGPNGSGKTTVLQALDAVRHTNRSFEELVSVGVPHTNESYVEVGLVWGEPQDRVHRQMRWIKGSGIGVGPQLPGRVMNFDPHPIDAVLKGIRTFSFDARAIAAPVQVGGPLELESDGSRLAAVLDGLRDKAPDRFDAISAELCRWLPEFDRILFDPGQGTKSIALRTREGHHSIPATDLSQGTLIALALLTLAHLPEPPTIVGLEEPDRGINPRLLRRVKDAIYRLSYPESCGEKREPVQVIATTHSPYFVDLFKEHLDEIVICEKTGHEVQFKRASELPNIDEIIGDASLGEAWYTGILGGVPTEP